MTINVYNVDMADILGGFEQAVLLALIKLGDKAYGRAILKEVAIRLNRDVAAGAVYATLDRLEAKRMISSRLATGIAARGGRARRYYKPEAAGTTALNETKATLENLWRDTVWPTGGQACIHLLTQALGRTL
jgi:PadR family transcriptional regulator PadR